MSEEQIELRLEKLEKLITSQSILNKVALNISEVADLTGLSKLYIYKLTSKNEIPHYKPNGKNIFFKKEEIDNWLLRNRQSTNEELVSDAMNYVVSNKAK